MQLEAVLEAVLEAEVVQSLLGELVLREWWPVHRRSWEEVLPGGVAAFHLVVRMVLFRERERTG